MKTTSFNLRRHAARGLSAALAQRRPPPPAPAAMPSPVTVDNFIRAESDLYFGRRGKKGGFGKFFHHRELAPIDGQTSIQRCNRDTLYSAACVRPRCRAGDDHAAGRGQALHVDAGDRRGPLRARGRLRRRQSHPHQAEDRHALRRWSAIRMLVDPSDSDGRGAGPRACRMRSRSSSPAARANSRCRTGTRSARRRCATRCWCSARPR